MPDLTAAVDSVLDRLTAAGIRATCDERDINPPCVYLAPPAVEFRFGRSGFTAAFTAWCVTGSAGRRVDLGNLSQLLDRVGQALDFSGVRADPGDLVVPDMAVPLPAYRLTWTERFNSPPAT